MLFSSNKTNKNPSSSSSFLGELFQSFSDAKEYASSMKRKLAASKGTEDEAYYSKKLATAEQNAKSLEEQITALKTDATAITSASASAAAATATPAPAVAPVPAAEAVTAAPAVTDITAASATVASGVAVQTVAASPTATASSVVATSAPADAVADKAVESAAPADAVADKAVESAAHASAIAGGFEATEEAAATDVAHDYQTISAAEAIEGFTDASIAHADVAVERLDDTDFDEDGIDELAINLADSDVRGSALSNADIDEAYDSKYSNDLSDAVEALAALSLAEMEDEVANSASYESVSDDEIADEPSDYADYEDSAAPPNENLDAPEAKTADAVAAESFADDATESVEVDMDSLDELLSDDEVIGSDESLDSGDADILTDSAAEDVADADEAADADDAADADSAAEDVADADEARAVECDPSAATAESPSEAVKSAVTDSAVQASVSETTTSVKDADGYADSAASESVHAAKAVDTAADSKAATDAVADESKTNANADVAVVADTAESEVGSNQDTVAGAAVAVAKEVATTKKLAAATKALEKAKAKAKAQNAGAAADAADAAGVAKAKGAAGAEAGKNDGGDEGKDNSGAKGTSTKRRLKDLALMRIEGDSVYLKDGESHFAQMRMKLRKSLATAIEEAGEHLPEWFELSCTMMLLFGGLGIQEVEYTTRVMLAAAWRRRQTSAGVRSCLMRKEFMDDLSPVVDVHRLAIKASDSVMNKERRELHARCYDYIHSDDFIGKGAFEDMCHELSTEFVHLSEREIVLRCRLQWYQGLVDFAKVNADHKAVVAQYDKRLIASKIEIRPTMAAYAYTESYDSAAGVGTFATATTEGAAGCDSAGVGAACAGAEGVAASSAVIDAATAKYEKAVRKYILAGKLHFVPSAQEVFEVCSGVAPVLADAEKQYIAEVLCNRYEAQVLDKRNARMRAGDMSSLRNAIKRFKLLTEERDAVANTLQSFLGRMGTIIKSMKACKARNLTASGSCASAIGLAADKGELLDNSLVSAFDLEREALNHDAQALLDAAAEQLDGYGSSLGADDDTTGVVRGAEASYGEHRAIDGLASSYKADSLGSAIAAAAAAAATDAKGTASIAASEDREDSAHSTTDDYSSTGVARASDYLDSLDETMGGRAASAAQDGDTASYDGDIASQDHDITAGLAGDDGAGSEQLGEKSLSSSTAEAVGEAVGSVHDSELSADALQKHMEDRAMESVDSELSSAKDANAVASDATATAVADRADGVSAAAVSVASANVLTDSEEHGDAYSAITETMEVATAIQSYGTAKEQASAATCVAQASAGAVGHANAQVQVHEQAQVAGAALVATGTAVAEDSEDDTDSVSNESGQTGTTSISGQRTTTTAKGGNQARVLASAAKDAPEGCQISLEAGDQMIMGPSYKRRQYAKAMNSSKQCEPTATASGSVGAAANAAAHAAANAKAAVEAVGGMSLGLGLTAGANGSAHYGDIEDVFSSDRGCDMDTSVILHKQDKSAVAANDALAPNGGCASASALNAVFGHAALAAAEESGLVEDYHNGLAGSDTVGHTAFGADKAVGAIKAVEADEAASASDADAADAADAGADDIDAGVVAGDRAATGAAKGFKSHSKTKAKAKAKNKSWKHRKAHQVLGGDAHAAHRSNLSQALAQASALGGVCQTVNLSQALGMFQEPAKAGSASLPLTSEYLAKPQSAYEHGSTILETQSND